MSAPLDLEAELRRMRSGDRYHMHEPRPGDAPDKHAPLADALAATLQETPDSAHAAEAARHPIECFQNCHVGGFAYSDGLADIVTDDRIPPSVVRHTLRRTRGEATTLPPLAELRAMMLAERRARQWFLAGLEAFPRALAEAQRRHEEEARRIAAAAVRHGASLSVQDISNTWLGAGEGWLH